MILPNETDRLAVTFAKSLSEEQFKSLGFNGGDGGGIDLKLLFKFLRSLSREQFETFCQCLNEGQTKLFVELYDAVQEKAS